MTVSIFSPLSSGAQWTSNAFSWKNLLQFPNFLIREENHIISHFNKFLQDEHECQSGLSLLVLWHCMLLLCNTSTWRPGYTRYVSKCLMRWKRKLPKFLSPNKNSVNFAELWLSTRWFLLSCYHDVCKQSTNIDECFVQRFLLDTRRIFLHNTVNKIKCIFSCSTVNKFMQYIYTCWYSICIYFYLLTLRSAFELWPFLQ